MSLDLDQCFRISRHADLKVRAEGDVLVLPERAMRIGGSGGEILRVIGTKGVRGRELLETMRARYRQDPDVMAHVTDFVEEMLSLGGIEIVEVGAEGKR